MNQFVQTTKCSRDSLPHVAECWWLSVLVHLYMIPFLACMRVLHRFNMEHDGSQNDCNPSGNIMASRLATGPGMFKWSSCSASYLEQYRRRGLTDCLRDTPGGSGTVAISGISLPGRNMTPTEQCRKSRGSSSGLCNFSQTPDVSTHTPTHTRAHVHSHAHTTHHTHTTHTHTCVHCMHSLNLPLQQFCGNMYCRGTDNLCYGQAPLEGTRCDTGKVSGPWILSGLPPPTHACAHTHTRTHTHTHARTHIHTQQ